nr:immunoglobulin light chain junction region [Macaca mulatta]MOY15539.1 immunoglobulin light chain junction region [Macaca mulatta]MOY15591.1 immunoglobulin light chain junction region [Macaca mulatta]MOY15621.1 immunoglobulin light chain junction region [Macaca mulatta]MOY16853.1 immunoglobulin light chain junction region [Macaca mulatta]
DYYCQVWEIGSDLPVF